MCARRYEIYLRVFKFDVSRVIVIKNQEFFVFVVAVVVTALLFLLLWWWWLLFWLLFLINPQQYGIEHLQMMYVFLVIIRTSYSK
jgi:fatty acid desaturase